MLACLDNLTIPRDAFIKCECETLIDLVTIKIQYHHLSSSLQFELHVIVVNFSLLFTSISLTESCLHYQNYFLFVFELVPSSALAFEVPSLAAYTELVSAYQIEYSNQLL